MSYKLPEKLKSIAPYDPAEGASRIRLDANESFISLSDAMRERIASAVKGIDFNRYPDPWARGVCGLAGALFDYPAENIVAGNGSDELISVIISAFASNGDTVLISEPDFSMYRFYSNICELVCVPLEKEKLHTDIDAMIHAAKVNKAAIVIFSNPCNPCGTGVSKEEVLRLIKSVDSLVIVDEAYMDFWDQSIIDELPGLNNAIVLKTCSKAFGLAGIRLGFALGARALTDGIRKVKSPFNVNAVTQAIGEAVLSERQFLLQARAEILHSKQALDGLLNNLALKYPRQIEFLPTVTNFALLKCKNVDFLYGELLKKSICVRKTMGCFLRITAGTDAENRELVQELEKLLQEEENI